MDRKDKVLIQEVLESKSLGLVGIFPEKPSGDVRFLDIAVRSYTYPSDVLNALDEAGLSYREGQAQLFDQERPRLKYLGAYPIRIVVRQEITLSFEDVNAP